MDNIKSKIEYHQEVLKKYIQELSTQYNTSLGSTKNYHAIIDLQSNHFQFVRIGWQEEQFIYSVLIHLSINEKTGNIWILQNNTDIEIDEELKIIAGIPKNNFVLGFYPAYAREQSEYAVA